MAPDTEPPPPEPAPLEPAPLEYGATAPVPERETNAPPPSAPSPSVPPLGRHHAEGPGILRIALVFYGVVALFAFGYALFSSQLKTLFGEEGPALTGLLGGLGLGLGIVVVSRVGARAWRSVGRASEALADILGPVTTRDALVLAVLSGAAEELLFRGALWGHLGLVGTTLLFGLVHFIPRRRLWIYPLFATGAGFLLGLLREGTGSLWPPVVLHIVVNAFNLVWIGALAQKRVDARASGAGTEARVEGGARDA